MFVCCWCGFGWTYVVICAACFDSLPFLYFYTSSIWLLSSVCVCCCIVYCFCSSQGLAWMQKVMVPRSNSFSFNLLFNFFILTRGLVWNRSTFVYWDFQPSHRKLIPWICVSVPLLLVAMHKNSLKLILKIEVAINCRWTNLYKSVWQLARPTGSHSTVRWLVNKNRITTDFDNI